MTPEQIEAYCIESERRQAAEKAARAAANKKLASDAAKSQSYTHVVNKPDAQVSHSFSLSGWDMPARHAAIVKPGGSYDYLTLCGKDIRMDPEYREVAARRGEVVVTCNHCRKKLGLKPLAK
jgi:hypothetical protein